MVTWLRTLLSREQFPFTCDEIRVFWRRAHWHAFIQYKTPREERDEPWAYGTLGAHVFPNDEGRPGACTRPRYPHSPPQGATSRGPMG